jgi:hypothetical protein
MSGMGRKTSVGMMGKLAGEEKAKAAVMRSRTTGRGL